MSGLICVIFTALSRVHRLFMVTKNKPLQNRYCCKFLAVHSRFTRCSLSWFTLGSVRKNRVFFHRYIFAIYHCGNSHVPVGNVGQSPHSTGNQLSRFMGDHSPVSSGGQSSRFSGGQSGQIQSSAVGLSLGVRLITTTLYCYNFSNSKQLNIENEPTPSNNELFSRYNKAHANTIGPPNSGHVSASLIGVIGYTKTAPLSNRHEALPDMVRIGQI